MGERIVLDLETQREFSEVEGRKPELLGISVVGIYRYGADRYDTYLESELRNLVPILQEAELLIGFNIKRFDLPVLSPYLPFATTTLPVLDILDDVVKQLGHRVSLESLAQATLGKGKSGSGLQALAWFKEGKFDLIKQYCLDDVRLTKEVYDHGRAHGKLLAVNRYGTDTLQIPVFWPERKRDIATIMRVLQEAHAKRLQVEIEYLSMSVQLGESSQRIRRVDVYHVREPFIEGYCHFRNDIRQFRIDRILDIKPTWQRYTIPPDFVPTAIAE